MMEYKCNYFIGNDPSKWRTDVPNYEAVTLRNVYDGVDLHFHRGGDGRLAYEYSIAPNANASRIKFEYEGLEEMSVDEFGRMVARIKWGEITGMLTSPCDEAFSGFGGLPLLSAGTQPSDLHMSASAGPGTRAVELVYFTYLGGTDSDEGFGVAVDDSGCAYVTGYTDYSDFPIENPYQTHQGGYDVIVTKLTLPEPVCGDADNSGVVDIDDIVYVVLYIFSGDPAPDPYDSGDFDCTGMVDIDDAVWLVNFIFSGGNAPCDTDGDGVPDC